MTTPDDAYRFATARRRRHRSPLRRLQATLLLSLAMLCVVSVAAGCRTSAASTTAQPDTALSRDARRAEQAFREGYDDEAVTRYRAALRRAWEIDEAESIGNVAYNLAAVLASMRQHEAAAEAVAEARAELDRSGASLADAWLLEAKIARAQGRFEDAAYLTDHVAEPAIRCSPECTEPPPARFHRGRGKSLRDALARGRHHEPPEDRCRDNTVALALFRANLHLDQGAVSSARAEVDRARGLIDAENAKHHSPASAAASRAEIAATHARVLTAEGRPAAAARELDVETRWLKEAEHYRELPMANVAAAEALLEAGMPQEAAERYFRAARILYGRDDLLAALHFLEQSMELAIEFTATDLQLRGNLLLGEIDRAHRAKSKPRRDAIEPEDIEPVEADPLDVERSREELPPDAADPLAPPDSQEFPENRLRSSPIS